jgi:hypothetical protein
MVDYNKKRDELLALQKIRGLEHHETFMLSRIENYLQAIENGMKYFVYQGGIREKTLDFCKIRNNKVFSIEELMSWKDDQDRPKTNNYDPVLHLGGNKCFEGDSYCYHNFGFITNDLARKRRPDIKESELDFKNTELDKSLSKNTLIIIEKKRAELLANSDPLVKEHINSLLNQFANEVIGDKDSLLLNGEKISIEDAVENISKKIIIITDLITKQLKGLHFK